MSIFGQKNVNSVKTTLYYGPKKSTGCPFFPILHEKINALMPIFCQKNVHSLKNHAALIPIFCQKNFNPLKNTVLSCIFFQIFHEKPPAVMPIFGQKNVNSVKTKLYYGPKKSIGCPFSPIFHQKITAPVPIFCQKKSIL